MRDYAYDAKHFTNVPAPGHGGSIHNRECQHPECQRTISPSHFGRPPRYGKDGKVEPGTNAESVWRDAVGLPRF
jgi:hypothetical protein